MKKIVILLVFILPLTCVSYAQDTYDLVYNIFQNSCAAYCHGGGGAGGMDLSGSGANAKSDVWNNLYDISPTNSFAASQGYKRIFPGDPYRSSLFRKINHGMDDFVTLDPSEGDDMPSMELKDREKELIRQWILFGSPETGNVVDTALIGQYYDGQGVDGIASRPAAPPVDSGLQIKLGPYFLYANEEHEYYYKYPLNNDSIEVNKVFSDLGQTYSHHLIIYRFITPDSSINVGLREDNAHANVDIVTAHQATETVSLPEGTAFYWDANTVLDLNTHYINYHPSKVLKCENYINVYTQPKNTAVHQMNSELYVNTLIYIPNDGNNYTFNQPIFDASSTQNIYVWSMYSHTHQWGKDYDVWMRNSNNTKGTQVYDASTMDGDPNGVQIGYDYQHPPTRRWEYPFLATPANEGFIHEAVFNNTGPNDVMWGLTSDDEMMVFLLMYLDDTTGLAGTGTTSAIAPNTTPKELHIYPNPFSRSAIINLPFIEGKTYTLDLYDILGNKVRRIENIVSEKVLLNKGNLTPGLYVLELNTKGHTYKEKLMID